MSKTDSTVDIALLEHCLREDLNRRCRRAMAVLRPLKLVIENWPAGKAEELEAVNNPEDPAAGTRTVPFTGELFIEQDDFREVPPPKYYRLSPGQQVRLRYGYIVTCTGVKKNPSTGAVEEVRCTYDPATRGGNAPDNRKVKATIHWVSAAHALSVEAGCTITCFLRSSPRRCRLAWTGRTRSTLRRWRSSKRRAWNRRWAARCRETGFSSNGWATSVWTPTHAGEGSCSTARCP